jgi:hypothetical protein
MEDIERRPTLQGDPRPNQRVGAECPSFPLDCSKR